MILVRGKSQNMNLTQLNSTYMYSALFKLNFSADRNSNVGHM